MNYEGNEQLHADIAALVNSMCELRHTLNSLEFRYGDNEGKLTEQLARQTFCRINAFYLKAYREVLALETCFKN